MKCKEIIKRRILLKISELYPYTYISCVRTRIYAHARAYIRMEATHFSGIGFSGNRRGSAFLPWMGVAWVFPEKRVDRGRLPCRGKTFPERTMDRGQRPRRVSVPGRSDSDKRAQESPRLMPRALIITSGKSEPRFPLRLPAGLQSLRQSGYRQ